MRARYVPRVIGLGIMLHELLPEPVERILLHALRRWHFDRVTQPPTPGNVYTPDNEPARVHGERGPQTSNAGFTLWTLTELFRKRFRKPIHQSTALEV